MSVNKILKKLEDEINANFDDCGKGLHLTSKCCGNCGYFVADDVRGHTGSCNMNSNASIKFYYSSYCNKYCETQLRSF